MVHSKNNSTPESKPMYDSRCDETSGAVDYAAAAVAAAAAAAARGRSCINHRVQASTDSCCCFGKTPTCLEM